MTFNERLDEIILLYQEGVAGNAAAVEQANQLLEQLRRDSPSHPLAEAYHGSIMVLVARDKTNPIEKLRWSKNGLKLLDNAAAAAPQDSMIRLLRGKATYALPEKHFSRTQTAIEDFTFLIDQKLRGEGTLKPEVYLRITYELGEAYCRIGRNEDAVRCWKSLEERTQDPLLQQLLQEKIQSLEGKPSVENVQSPGTASSIMMGVAYRAAGSALQNWAKKEEEKAARRKKRKSRH